MNRLLAIGYTFVFELLLLVMLALQGMPPCLRALPIHCRFFRHYAAIVAAAAGGQHWPDRLGPAAVRAAFADLHLRPPAAHARSQLPGTIFCNGRVVGLLPCVLVYILHFWRLSYIYGSLTAVILIILWLYVIINLLFLGAGLNAEMNRENRAMTAAA